MYRFGRVVTIIIIIGVIVLALSLVLVLADVFDSMLIDSAESAQTELFETSEDYFIDIDGDGDLDYVHFVQFIRQENEEADPYPAPNQPGQ